MGVSKWAWPCDVGMDAYRGHTHFACPCPYVVGAHVLWPRIALWAPKLRMILGAHNARFAWPHPSNKWATMCIHSTT